MIWGSPENLAISRPLHFLGFCRFIFICNIFQVLHGWSGSISGPSQANPQISRRLVLRSEFRPRSTSPLKDARPSGQVGGAKGFKLSKPSVIGRSSFAGELLIRSVLRAMGATEAIHRIFARTSRPAAEPDA